MLLSLRAGVSIQQAKNELFWRETHSRKRDKPYRDPVSDDPNHCRIQELAIHVVAGANALDVVITTRFGPTLDNPSAEHLATCAISSVRTAPAGKDGISYLMSNLRHGVETPLTPTYHDAILRRLGASNLAEALREAARYPNERLR